MMDRDSESLNEKISETKIREASERKRFLDFYGIDIANPDLIQKTIDLLDHLYQYLGFRLSLDNLAEATLNETKSADGIIAVQWFREGKIDQVLDYCEQDVLVTHRLWEYGRENGHVKYRDREFRLQRVPVSW